MGLQESEMTSQLNQQYHHGSKLVYDVCSFYLCANAQQMICLELGKRAIYFKVILFVHCGQSSEQEVSI